MVHGPARSPRVFCVTQRLLLFCTLVAAVGLAAPTSAFADHHAPPPPAAAPAPASAPGGQPVVEETGGDERWRVEGQLGLGMPLGGAGVEVTSFIARGLSLSGGVGRSIHGPVQVGVMPRLSVVDLFGSVRLSVGVGLSYGDYEGLHLLDTDGGFYPNVLWGNLEASLALTLFGIGARAFFGFSQILSHGTDDGRSAPSESEIPYFGLGLGYNF